MTEIICENNITKTPRPNEKQCECINNVDGKYLVLAGPGTGKTFTVTHRIKHMVEDLKISPERILCLTFSNTAAREMKNKIGEKYSVNIYTYHEFCLDIMKEYDDIFGISNVNIITDSIKRNLIKECIDEIGPKAYNNEKNNPYQYTNEILNGIEEIKKNIPPFEEFCYEILKKNDVEYTNFIIFFLFNLERALKLKQKRIKRNNK